MSLSFSALAAIKLHAAVKWADDNRRGAEIGAFLVLNPEDNFIVDDIVVPKQTVTAASVDMDGDWCANFWGSLDDQCRGRYGWWHHHPFQSCTPSATDESTYANIFSGCPFSLMCITSKAGHMARAKTWHHGIAFARDLTVEFNFADLHGLKSKNIQDMLDSLENLVSSPTVHTNTTHFPPNLNTSGYSVKGGGAASTQLPFPEASHNNRSTTESTTTTEGIGRATNLLTAGDLPNTVATVSASSRNRMAQLFKSLNLTTVDHPLSRGESQDYAAFWLSCEPEEYPFECFEFLKWYRLTSNHSKNNIAYWLNKWNFSKELRPTNFMPWYDAMHAYFTTPSPTDQQALDIEKLIGDYTILLLEQDKYERLDGTTINPKEYRVT